MTSDLDIDVIFSNLIKLDHKKIKFELYSFFHNEQRYDSSIASDSYFIYNKNIVILFSEKSCESFIKYIKNHDEIIKTFDSTTDFNGYIKINIIYKQKIFYKNKYYFMKKRVCNINNMIFIYKNYYRKNNILKFIKNIKFKIKYKIYSTKYYKYYTNNYKIYIVMFYKNYYPILSNYKKYSLFKLII